MSLADEIKKLEELRQQGLLSDEEFASQKARLLGATSSTTGANEPPPDNYLVYAILVTVFCCLPFGIVAIVKSSGVASAMARGSIEDARRASAETMRWVKYSIIAGVLLVVAYAIFVVAGIGISSRGFRF